MPWKTADAMTLRHEFVELARQPGAIVSELCRRFNVSRKSAYKWLKRFAQSGVSGLQDRSRRPRHSPRQTSQPLITELLALRQAHPTWGGRILRTVLLDQGHRAVPSASTITDILRREGLILPERSKQSTAYQRFERSAPNELWQMDFKGHYPMSTGRCHPLTVLDDHSRFLVGLIACADEQTTTVQQALNNLFERYGLPNAILCDNGSPWGSTAEGDHFTQLQVWLMRLGIKMYHGRPYHPQTQGKVERFHRTLHNDLIVQGHWHDLAQCQARFDPFRHEYNAVRPHRELQMRKPISLYRPSTRPKPDRLPPIEYDLGDEVKVVKERGVIVWKNRTHFIGRAFQGLPVGLRKLQELLFEVRFLGHLLGRIDLSVPRPKNKHTALPLQPPTTELLNPQL